MADVSAAALVKLLLLGEASEAEAEAARALAADPPLLLWTVCAAARRDNFQPTCVGDAAHWLAEHALEVLKWEADLEAGPDPTEPWDAESSGNRVAAALQRAELAASLAADKGHATAELAFLLGLISQADQWLAMAGDSPEADVVACLPNWLTDTDETPAAAAVQQATGILAGRIAAPQSTEIDLDACRQRGVAGRRRWLESTDDLGGRLPWLSARLARLAALENRFEETLEMEKLEAMAEFAAGAGHEINNPLTVIAGRAQLFLREEKDPERRRALALMNVQAKRVYEMIADMMLFARPPRPELEPTDLVELLDGLIEDISPQAGQQETTIRRTSTDGPVQAEVDATQLTVAIRAMCQNALEAIGHEGHIEIDVQQDDREVTIRILDDGPGIPVDQRRHLFDPYYSARQAGRGLGLGLSKAWRIVTNHGGRIEVDSDPNHGTVFTITLPQRP